MIKSWHSLIQQFEGWRQKYQHHNSLWWKNNSSHKNLTRFSRSSHLSHYRQKKTITRFRHVLLMLVLGLIALTSVVGYRFYNQPQLTVGKISPLTIEAPYSAQFEDTKTTLERRKEVQTGITPILKQDRNLTTEIKNTLASYLENVEQLRKLTEPFPFFDTQILSLPSQQYIRFCPESEFKAVLASVSENFSQQSVNPEQNLSLETRPDFNLRLQKVALELQKYRLTSEFPFLGTGESDQYSENLILVSFSLLTQLVVLPDSKSKQLIKFPDVQE